MFHFDVPGSVAKSTHAGLPWLRFMRRKLGDRVHFWPFDGWAIPSGRSAVAEVYPSLWNRDYPREGRTADQHDAYSAAAWLCQTDQAGRLDEFLHPPLTPPMQTVAGLKDGFLVSFSGRLDPSVNRQSSGIAVLVHFA